MSVSYNGLWKMLIDKNMYKKDLAAELNISSATMAKMGKGENVSLEVLQKICEYMECDIGDIMSFEKDGKQIHEQIGGRYGYKGIGIWSGKRI